MIILGLTGSIGMGKSTTAEMFRSAGIPVHDADAVVHDLYAGTAAELVENTFPGVLRNGSIDRTELGRRVIGNPQEMRKLEAIIHPLVAERRQEFLERSRLEGNTLVVLDIPLLFETGGDAFCDFVAVVSAPPEVQRKRVLERPGMTEEKFLAILAKQVPDEEKRRRADFIIESGEGLEAARKQVAQIIARLSQQQETGR